MYFGGITLKLLCHRPFILCAVGLKKYSEINVKKILQSIHIKFLPLGNSGGYTGAAGGGGISISAPSSDVD